MTVIDTAGTAGTTAAPSTTAHSTVPSAVATRWTPVCRRDDLEPLWGEAALVDGDQVALVLLPAGAATGDPATEPARVVAVSNLDPATGAAVMSRGIVGSRGGRPTLASPLHKDVFDLESGACLTKPQLRLPTWRVRERDGLVEVARRSALVAASHGTSDPAGQAAVADLVAAVRRAHPGVDVLDSFVDVQQPDVPATMGGLPAEQPVAVVPLLLSAGYHVHVDLAEAAEEAASADRPRPVAVTGALGPDPRLALVLARRLREAGLADGDHVVLAAAGSSDASAVADCHRMGELLGLELGRPVTVSFISAASPRVPEAVAATRAAHPGERVAVSSYLLAPGYFAGLAVDAGGDLTSAPLLVDGEDAPPELVAIVGDLYTRAAARL